MNINKNRILNFSKCENKKSKISYKNNNKSLDKFLNILISHKILLFSLFLLSSFQYVKNSIIQAYPNTILDQSYGGDIHLITIYENNTEYHMLIISIFYNSVFLYKYDKYGNLIKKIEHDLPYQYSGYIKSINGESSFIASANEIPAFFNETNIVQLNGMPHCGRPGVGATSFRDSSFIISGGKDFKSRDSYNFVILYYDNNFNLKTSKDVHPTDDPNLCLLTGDSAIIATEYLYYFLAFYAEKSSKNLIIKTMSYNDKINEFEEIYVVNTTDYYEILSFDVDYIDYKNHNLIIFCFHKDISTCLYGKYDHNNKQLIYDKNNEYKIPIKCYYRQITMRIFKNNHSFYLICPPYTDGKLKTDYFQLSIIRYEDGKPLFSEEGKENIKIQIYNKNTGYFGKPSFVFFEKKGPAIVYEGRDDLYYYEIAYFNPISCLNSTINLFSYTKNNKVLFSDYFVINYNSSKINQNFIIIEIPEGIKLYNINGEMKINEEYNYNTYFNITTTKPGIYNIKYFPVSTNKYICEFKLNVILNNEKGNENEDNGEVCLKDFSKLNGECVSSKEIIFWNLTDYCNTVCTKSNYLYCLKGFDKEKDLSQCICKQGYHGKKCEENSDIEKPENNDKYIIKEIIKVKKEGIYKGNQFYLYNEYYEYHQNLYINNVHIFTYQQDLEFDYNIIEDGKLITKFPNTYIKIYNFK